MRSGFVVALACAAVSLAGAACLDLGLSGFTSPSDGTDAGDAASLGDSTSGSDASAGDADSGCPGSTTALFCDDFDHGPLGARWSSRAISSATLALSDAASTSPPFSLLAEAPATNIMGGAQASLTVDLAVAPRKVRSSFDVYFDSVGNRGATIGTIILQNGLRSYDVSLFARSDGMHIDENLSLPDGGNAQTVHPITTIKSKTWTRVVIEIDYGGPGGATPTLTVTLRQPPTAPATPELDHIAIAPTITGTAMTVYVGLEDMNLPSVVGWRAFFDNVLIEAP